MFPSCSLGHLTPFVSDFYKTLDAKFNLLIGLVSRPILVGCICFAILLIVGLLMPENINLFVSLIIKGIVGVLAWITAIYIFRPDTLWDLMISQLNKLKNH